MKHLTRDQIIRWSKATKICEISVPEHIRTWFTYGDDDEVERRLEIESGNLYCNDELENNLAEKMKLDALLENCSVVVGLHPDQATEFIVDYCLDKKRNKKETPFAIIPCCVFQNSTVFRHRQHVKSYDKFLDYLCEKDTRIQKKVLEFPGRNVVLFFNPKNVSCK